MLFPKEQEVTRTWKTVVEAVITDRLGPSAKVAPDDGKDERLSEPEQVLAVFLRSADLYQSVSTPKTSETKMMYYACSKNLKTWTFSVMGETSTTSLTLSRIWTYTQRLLTSMGYKQASTVVRKCWLPLGPLSCLHLKTPPRSKSAEFSRASTKWHSFLTH